MKKIVLRNGFEFNKYLKIQKIISNSIKLEIQLLNNYRQFYNPNQFGIQIRTAYRDNQIFQLLGYIALYFSNSIIFYFLPLWIIIFPFVFIKNLNIWKATFIFLRKKQEVKLTFFINYHAKVQALAKHKVGFAIFGSQWKESINLKFVISFFPFIFGISYIIYSRYRNQTFSYFFNKNLPGAYSSYPQLTWQTFEHITFFKLKPEPVFSNLNQIKDPSLTPNESVMSNNINMISSNQINRNLKTQAEKPNLVNFADFSDDQIQDKNFRLKLNLINRINPEFKRSRFIKQLDFYNDSVLIKLNSKWQHKKKQHYVGVFHKLNNQQFYSWLNQSSLLTLPVRFKQGLNSLQKDNSNELGSYIEKNFLERKNKITSKTGKATIHTFNIGNNWGLISPQLSNFPNLGYKLTSNKDNSEFFYLNLDELPQKLNSSQTLNLLTQFTKSETSRTNQMLPIKNKYFFFIEKEHQNFLQESLTKDTNLNIINSQQKVLFFNKYSQASSTRTSLMFKERLEKKPTKLVFKARQITNLFSFQPFTKTLKESNVNFSSLASGHCLTLKKISQKSHLKVQPTLPIKNSQPINALDGFYGNLNFQQSLKVPPISESLLLKKLYLLENELKPQFYANGFTFQGVMTDLLNFQFPLFIKENENMDQIKDSILKNNLTTYKSLISLVGDINLLRKSTNAISFNKKITDSTQEFHTLVDNKPSKNNSNFNEKNYSDSLTDTLIDEPEDSSQLENYSSEQILHILEDVVPLKPNVHLDPRLMSGYNFPDTPSKEVQLVVLQSFYKNLFLRINEFLPRLIQRKKFKFWSPTVKVELPSSLTSYLNYDYSNPNSLTFKLKYRPTFLKGSKRAIYQGPGVLLDNLTQDLHFTNKEETRKWIKQFFSSDNPLTARRQAFCNENFITLDTNNGVNDIPKLNENLKHTLSKLNKTNFSQNENFSPSQQNEIVDKQTDNPQNFVNLGSQSSWRLAENEFNTQLKKIKKQITRTKKIDQLFFTPTFSEKMQRSLKVPILPFIEEFHIPYLSKSQWNIVLENLKINLQEQFQDKRESEDNKLEGIIPLIRIRKPTQQKIHWPLNQLDYQNLNNFVWSYNFQQHPTTNLRTSSKSTKLILEENSQFSLNASPNRKISVFPSHNNEVKVNKLCSNIKSGDFSVKGLDLIYKGLEKNQTFKLFKSNKDISKQIIFHYLPSANSALNQNLTENKIFGSVYKNVFTIYKNTLKNSFSSLDKVFNLNLNKKLVNYLSPPFYESWEPITLGSWMVITKISLGFIVLLIFKDIYNKYGKELLVYLVELLQALGIVDEGFKEELQIDDDSKAFRIIKKVPKRFRDIAGIDRILPEIGEIIWFLKNYGRSFTVGNILPKGILLVGSPGTGKTLLVQAIAGEAEVPVLIQSGSSLKDLEKEGRGLQTLFDLFQEARQLAPCIVFIDEIDTLGEKRESIMQNPMGADEVIESIQQDRYVPNLNNEEFIPTPKINLNKNSSDLSERDLMNLSLQERQDGEPVNFGEISPAQIVQESLDKQNSQQYQLSLLMQLLIEMDGLQGRKGVIVIGATNRPNAIDLALTRPGRFDQILHIELPEKQKRIDILKFYSKNLGTENQIFKSPKEINFGFTNQTWEYLANRTIGFSAADLAAVMNESSMKAILNETVHTIETIEHGIEKLTSYSTEQMKLELKKPTDPFFVSRLAYYQAGKAVVHTLLLEHPSVIVLHLWPRRKNARHTYIHTIIQNYFFQKSKKFELESRIVGLYAGKAAEFLALTGSAGTLETKYAVPAHSDKTAQKVQQGLKNKAGYIWKKPLNKKKFNFPTPVDLKGNTELQVQKQAFNSLTFEQSDLGIEDLSFATSLAQLMISKWYFYSRNLIVPQSSELLPHQNEDEIPELEKTDLFNYLAIQNETIGNTNYSELSGKKWSIRPWWQTRIMLTTRMVDPAYMNWYRIYLANPEERERNEEWIPPDEYYHNNYNLLDLGASSTKSIIDFNDLYAIDRDYIYHGLLLTCFNTAFSILDKNRELVDYFASYLMRNEILREHEITDIFSQFKVIGKEKTLEPVLDEKQIQPNLKSNIEISVNVEQPLLAQDEQVQLKSSISKFKIAEKSWGKYSKRKVFHFFNFDSIVGKTNKA